MAKKVKPERRKLPRSVFRQRLVKTAFWIGAAYLLFTVTVLLIRPDSGASAQEEIVEKIANPATDPGVQTFATNFAYHYFTWGRGDEAIDDREKRLKPYLAAGVDSQAGLNMKNMKSKAEFMKAQIWKVEDAGPNASKVTLRAQYLVTGGGKETKLNYLVVPIKSDGQNFVVSDIPYFTQPPKDVELEKASDDLDRTNSLRDSRTKEEIKDFLDSFFRVYANGKQEEISYFTKNVEVPGLTGILTFKGIKKAEIYTNLEDQGIYQVETSIAFGDSKGATSYIYPYYVELTQENGRWFVTKFKQN
ncbi:hypothetical protein B9G55_23870 [Saccharibacillus sp. O16]|nr:hypothetical protein B9G55_23870 [Saccharibacillus sp. O16]